MSTSTQAIMLDYNRLSCPTPSNQFKNDNFHIQMGKISFLLDMQYNLYSTLVKRGKRRRSASH